MRLILVIALLAAFPAPTKPSSAAILSVASTYAGGFDPETLSARISCPMVRILYRHYAKQGFRADQMAQFLSSKGISESRIAKLAQCIKAA